MTLMAKQELLAELAYRSYVVLRPSPIEGIGVFALRDIPKGCRDMFSKPLPDDKWITVSREEVSALPVHAQWLISNYCLFDENNYFVPASGFKRIDVSLFLNHSNVPNVISINEGEFFEALHDIKAGEELVIDYGEIVAEYGE
jgi:SET domain-containing protein